MAKMQKMADKAIDLFERVVSDQTSRTGDAAARITSALANGVDAEVIALQMSKNSKKNNPDNPVTFTEEKVFAIRDLFDANQTRSAYTKEQSGEMIRMQRAADNAEPEGEPA